MTSIVAAVAPLLILIALGFALGRSQFLSRHQFEGLSKLTFTLFIPALLFLSIYQSEQLEQVSLSLLGAFYLPLVILFVGSYGLFNTLVGQQFSKVELLCLASTFSNNVLIGVPILLALVGESILLPAFTIIAFHSLLLFSLTSFAASFGESQRVSWYRQIATSIWLTTRSPIVLSLLAGLIARLLELELGSLTIACLTSLKQAALPCALLLLGATLGQYKVRGNYWLIALVTTNKLLILPLLIWLSSVYLFQLPNTLTVIAVTLSASPVGINVFMFAAQDPDCSPHLASMILISALISLISIPLWLLFLGLA
jgi:hypothetical protein